MRLETLVLASGNAGKLAELEGLLQPLDIRVRARSEFTDIEPDETGLTFFENALIKARAAVAVSDLPALGDDSGLVVEALDGAPGIRSARFAGPEADDEANNRLLLEKLQGVPTERRGATFLCTLVLLRHAEDPDPVLVSGRWRGRILEAPRGEGGFGYDPLFYDEQLGATAAELPAAEKGRVSHRGKAMLKLAEALRGSY